MGAVERYKEGIDRLCQSLNATRELAESLDKALLREVRRLFVQPVDDAMLVAIANEDSRTQFLLGIDRLAQASVEEDPWAMAIAVLCLMDFPGAREAWPQYALGAS